MAKKKTEKAKKYKLKDVIKFLELSETDNVLLLFYNKKEEILTTVNEISDTIAKKNVMLIQPKQGGQEHRHSLYRVVLE